jgi:c-di-GMP-binding flagellar brake protein YcgR
VEWGNVTLSAEIDNVCNGGALIAKASTVPRVGEEVLVTFHAKKEDTAVEASVISRVVHVRRNSEEEGRGSFGVKFGEPIEEVKSKLSPVFELSIPTRID